MYEDEIGIIDEGLDSSSVYEENAPSDTSVKKSDNKKRPRKNSGKRRRKSSPVVRGLCLAFAFLVPVFSITVLLTIFRYDILPSLHRVLAISSIVLLCLLVIFLSARTVKRKNRGVMSLIVGVLSLSILFYMTLALKSGVELLHSISVDREAAVKETVYTIRVLAKSPLKSASDLKRRLVYAPTETDGENVNKFKTEFASKEGFELGIKNTSTYMDAVASLYAHKADAIIFNESELNKIKKLHPDFENETRILGGQGGTGTLSIFDKKDLSKDSFSIYLSGLDTDGPLDTQGRSDSNIILTVNPQTRIALMTAIPRDAYVPIDGDVDKMDKLTHSGNFGAESGLKALEYTINEPIDYWAKVNFSSVIDLVDGIGGITVDNPYEFDFSNKIFFDQGRINLNGTEALAFSRERYSLPGGDLDRNMHQSMIIKALIDKLSGPELLTNFKKVMQLIGQTVETSMSKEEIMQLVNRQIEDTSPWTIITYQIEGEGASGLPSYCMPGSDIYMYLLHEDSIGLARQKMMAVMEGESKEAVDALQLDDEEAEYGSYEEYSSGSGSEAAEFKGESAVGNYGSEESENSPDALSQ